MNRAREFLLLESMSARAVALPDERRRAARPHVDRARERHLAADFADAITASLAAVDALEVDDPDVVAAAAKARTALAEKDKVDQAIFVSDARAAHQALYEAVAPYTLDLRTLRRAQIRRVAAILGFAVFGLLFMVWFLRRPSELRAEASAVYGGQFPAFRAVDGDITSEWLLPDRSVGWIEITISPPRPVSKVKLMNARNVPYNDRSTGLFRVEAFFEGNPLGAGDGSFTGFSAAPTWREIELDGRKTDKLKIFVKSFLESGAGFAEITVE